MFDPVIVAELAGRVMAINRHPALVAIDGHGGAGKSTLARQLVDALGARTSAWLVEGDDFYRPMSMEKREALGPAAGADRYFDWQRLREQVVVPVANGSHQLNYQRFDWTTGELGAWVDVEMPDVVVIEGVYSLRVELREDVDLGVYVETDRREALRRQVDRGENTDEWIRRWADAEDHYVRTHEPSSAADLTISGA